MALSIKDHIEAGHYERDDKGRALVPHVAGHNAIIYTTNGPEHSPIVGHVLGQGITAWCATTKSLLPPSPRKVKVIRWAVYSKACEFLSSWVTRDAAEEEARECLPGAFIVELTGEYEIDRPLNARRSGVLAR